jgi:monoamine oxidase
MGQIPALLVKDIESAGGEVITNSPVRVIQHFDDGVIVKSDNRTISAKAVVVAMPPHLSGRIQYQPPMPALRDQLTQRMFMGTIIKCIAIYNTPFWRNSTSLGNTFVFGPQSVGAVNTAFDISPPEDVGGGGVGVLASFIAIDAPAYFNLTAEVREKKVLESFASWYGPAAAKPKSYLEKVWAEEPFVGGAYSSVMPMGGWTEYGPALAAPVGRIYWAGTETSERWPGFYEGAAQAAENAVNFVKADVAPTGDYKKSTTPDTPSAGSSTSPAASPASSSAVAALSIYSLLMVLSVAMIDIKN